MFFGGDWRYFWSENLSDFAHLPFAWDSSLNTGIGIPDSGTLWITSYFNLTAFITKFGLSWNLIGLLFYFIPSAIFSFFSALYLFKIIFPNKRKFGLIAGLIYLLNTYFLMVFFGGQTGVALAYSVAPLVLAKFIKLLNNNNFNNGLIAGLVLSLQLLFDPRFVYITLFTIMLFYSYNLSNFILLLRSKFINFLIPFIVALLLHSYWILPLLIFKSDPLPTGFDNTEGFRFFSFANFEDTISLLHPNWPENIFGKVSFMKPEFLILPILAYSSLIFIKNFKFQKNLKSQMQNNTIIEEINNKKIVIFLGLLGLLGAFLAKGANEPFEEINTWLFENIPGVSMFRDPTKWYILIALSYSILIPFSIVNINSWLNSKFKVQNSKLQLKIKNYISRLFAFSVVLYLMFLIYPIYSAQIEKVKLRDVPRDYVLLKDFLVKQPEFFRTIWIPSWQRYGYFSNNHPAIGRNEILVSKTPLEMVKELSNEKTINLLKQLGVKYIIVPYDSENEIFIKDRKYDEKLYFDTVNKLDGIEWFKKIDNFGKVVVFKLFNSKEHIYIDYSQVNTLSNLIPIIKYRVINPTEYNVEVENIQKGDKLIFSEAYDEYWKAELISSGSTYQVSSIKYNNFLNSFTFPAEGEYKIKLYYEPQKWVNYGLVISGFTLASVICFLVFSRLKLKV